MLINKSPLLTEKEIYAVSAVFGFIFGILLFTFFTPNYYKGNEQKNFEINEGSSLSMVIDDLYHKQIVPSKFNMHIAAIFYDAERKIKAGRYEIPNGLSYLGLIELLIKGTPGEQILITIPEGIWQHKLAQQLRIQAGMDSAKVMKLSRDKNFIKSLNIDAPTIEGYLLPDSYYFYSNATVEEILRRLNAEMINIFDSNARTQMKKLGRSKKEILIMASLIDGESNKTSEFKRIAGVYYNRLKRGIRLQADPTVQYLLREKKRHNKIYDKDLLIDSPYNTYIYTGLPPTPINNPGREAVIAALYPEEHNYLFFVADGTGGHVFAKTLREHNKNVAKYRRWRRNNK